MPTFGRKELLERDARRVHHRFEACLGSTGLHGAINQLIFLQHAQCQRVAFSRPDFMQEPAEVHELIEVERLI